MREDSSKTAIGVFDDYSTAERVARDLTNAGIPRDSIQVKSNFMTGAAGRSTSTDLDESHERHEGGIAGFFHRLFGGDDSEPYGGHYAEAVRRGKAVVCVTGTGDQIDDAVKIMNAAGAVDVDRHVANYRSEGYERHDPNAPPYSYEEANRERDRFRGSQESTSIPVIEEELQVGKRVVRRGGVRVYSHVVDEPVEEAVELREEHVRVERRPADRPLSRTDVDRLRDQSVEVPETAEELVVQKRARVREEVVVDKETTKRTERVRDNVRRTQVDIERLNEGEDYSTDFRRDWQSRYGNSGETYETYEPAYEYGYRSAGDPRYSGKNWSDVEETLRTDYMRNNPNSSWERMKGAVRYGWEKVTGKR
jgi:uncharacterized protein (TIGR02271 family)